MRRTNPASLRQNLVRIFESSPKAYHIKELSSLLAARGIQRPITSISFTTYALMIDGYHIKRVAPNTYQRWRVHGFTFRIPGTSLTIRL